MFALGVCFRLWVLGFFLLFQFFLNLSVFFEYLNFFEILEEFEELLLALSPCTASGRQFP